MHVADFTYLALYLTALLAVTAPLGRWLGSVLKGEPPIWLRWLAPIERAIYRNGGAHTDTDMTWREYATALIVFNLLGGALILALQLAQARLPLNPQGFGPVPLGVAVNTAVSFLTPAAEERTDYLRVHMTHLRQKLEADPHSPKHLKTDAGIGYRLVDA